MFQFKIKLDLERIRMRWENTYKNVNQHVKIYADYMIILSIIKSSIFNLSKNTSFMVPIKEGDTVIFYIYTGSFPILNEAWLVNNLRLIWKIERKFQAFIIIYFFFNNRLQMWQYAKELHPNGNISAKHA